MQAPTLKMPTLTKKALIQCWVIAAGFGVIGVELLGMYLLSMLA